MCWEEFDKITGQRLILMGRKYIIKDGFGSGSSRKSPWRYLRILKLKMFCNLILVLAFLLNLRLVKSGCPKDCQCKGHVQSSTETSFSSREYIVACVQLGLKSLQPDIHANVTHLYVSGNKFQHVTRKMFVKFKKLKSLDLSSNEIFSVEKGCFDQLENLESLDLSSNHIPEIYQGHFGNISRLRELLLTDNPITKVAVGAFDKLISLEDLNLSETLIEALPTFTVPSSVIHLYLDHTNIHLITPDSFKYYSQLEGLYLKRSKIRSLSNNVFRHAMQLKYLLLEYSTLTDIAEKAFEGSQLQTLSLQGTLIRSLPASGLSELINLNLKRVTNLWELRPSHLPNIKQLLVPYEFLCCPFMNRMYDTGEIGRIQEWNVQECKNTSTESPLEVKTTSRPTVRDIRGATTRRQKHDPSDPFLIEYSNDSSYFLTLNPCDAYVLPSGLVPLAGARKKHVLCLPRPDDFNPCEDLLGTSALRACTWIVGLCATIGNLVKFVVILFNRRKVNNHKLLMCTLAFANLCMGLYLLILVSVDLESSGHYNKYVKEWQFGSGCKVAGFLSIFSTQLAVFTLNLITLERYYTIVYPLHKAMWITVHQTAFLLFLGVVTSAVLAMLPLINISSYSKVAICLPFDVENTSSKAYVTFLLVSNGASFFAVLFSYVKMYCSIQHSTSTSFVDLNVAKKMAIIVLTNFFCWAPIAVFSLVAIYGQPLIDVSISKILLVFVYPINAFTNPFLYFLGTKRFKQDLRSALVCFGLHKKYSNSGLSEERIASAQLTTRALLTSTSRHGTYGNSGVSPILQSRRSSGQNNLGDVPRFKSSTSRNVVVKNCVSSPLPASAKDNFVNKRQRWRKSYDIAMKSDSFLPDTSKNVCEDFESSICEMVREEINLKPQREVINNDRNIVRDEYDDPNSFLHESSC